MRGAMAREVRRRQPATRYTGIDIDEDYSAAAALHCDQAFSADIETLPEERFAQLFPSDCWIFGDCLEHLRDPWAVLRSVRSGIDPEGCLLACIPNAQHWSVQWRLLSGRFFYEDSGLLDRTHLRWFTRETLLQTFADTGWHVDAGVARYVPHAAEAQALDAIRGFASAMGLPAETAVNDARPIQYVFKLVPSGDRR